MRRLPLRSPPRMRGKVTQSVEVLTNTGITPAYAGKSAADPLHSYNPRDHPRVCGEKAYSRVISGSL